MAHFSPKKELPFLELFRRFISQSRSGRRLQPNGKRVGKGTVTNYANTLRLLSDFSERKDFRLRIRLTRKLTSKEMEVERRYWKRFYKSFSDFLYDDLNCYDNYVGQCFKTIKAFFSWLNRDLGVLTGDFHKRFYTRGEEIAVLTLMPGGAD
jgi:hypothetical protein